MDEMAKIISSLKTLRVGPVMSEYDLQQKIALILGDNGILFEKERQIARGKRLDFLTQGGVVIEVKKGKPNRTQLNSQINRYGLCDTVCAIVIVVETSLQEPITMTDNGKPCAVVGLQKMWGIAI